MAGWLVSCCWIQASCRQALPREAGVLLLSTPCTCMSSTWASRLGSRCWTQVNCAQAVCQAVCPCVVPGGFEAGKLHIRQGSSWLQEGREQGSRRCVRGQYALSISAFRAASAGSIETFRTRLKPQTKTIFLLLC